MHAEPNIVALSSPLTLHVRILPTLPATGIISVVNFGGSQRSAIRIIRILAVKIGCRTLDRGQCGGSAAFRKAIPRQRLRTVSRSSRMDGGMSAVQSRYYMVRGMQIVQGGGGDGAPAEMSVEIDENCLDLRAAKRDGLVREGDKGKSLAKSSTATDANAYFGGLVHGLN
ncbi:hypothetical protein ASPWEDRAFT_589946 [Aspergillus wentii DTO 134E9]|uniref:Uncharacterized protein n=1 Tax=Aspergillus wentii DTO 134E9 TaxID=1073089 RepID=A0A1L9RCU4_ASPWE|nr:uncharacterized protein ASPWEDRAFT_589946 [Aspergillus wentii DTO 134E9]KAI9924310.1 hypothetical protein MW887_007260 [Aspergillus wentii]OJJ32731.1 hypothetical protein ASPWEDRAFT_589946 [Aspergillus wentii DTO 134E9]